MIEVILEKTIETRLYLLTLEYDNPGFQLQIFGHTDPELAEFDLEEETELIRDFLGLVAVPYGPDAGSRIYYNARQLGDLNYTIRSTTPEPETEEAGFIY